MQNNEIRFIDSKYNELFRIPDGGQITINYPDGHTENRTCKYIDEYHFYANDVCFHICQFAELMERNNRKYTPAKIEKYKLEHITQEEFLLMYSAKEGVERGCIGYVRADFGNGKEFYSSWFSEDKSLRTDAFANEIDNVINYFRENSDTPLLKSRSDMYNTCYNLKPTVFIGNEDIRGFKVETEKHTYYFKCNPRQGDYNLFCYCYDKQHLEKYKNLQFVDSNIVNMDKDKFFVGENGVTEVYYNPDATSGGQLVYNEISFDQIKHAARASKNTSEFFAHFDSRSTQYLIDIDTPEFRTNAESYINRKADFEERTADTVKGVKKAAGISPHKRNRENFER